MRENKWGLGAPTVELPGELRSTSSNDACVADSVRGRDVVTLQTCTMPDFENRLIMRADRV